jgi:formylglycine-generating enzyme required for sulfatase activity
VEIDGLRMDNTEVTHAEFARFVNATGHVIAAEQGRRLGAELAIAAVLLMPGNAPMQKGPRKSFPPRAGNLLIIVW